MSEPVNKGLRDAAMDYLKEQSGPEAEDDPGLFMLWLQSYKAMIFGGEGVSEEERAALRHLEVTHGRVKTEKAELDAPMSHILRWFGGDGGEDTSSIQRAELEGALDRVQKTLAEAAFQAGVAPDADLRVMPAAAEHLGLPPFVTLHTGRIFIDVADGRLDFRDPISDEHLFVFRQDDEWLAHQRGAWDRMEGPLRLEGAAAISLADTDTKIYLPSPDEDGDFTVHIVQDGRAVTVIHPAAETESAPAGEPRVTEVSGPEDIRALEERVRAQHDWQEVDFSNLAEMSTQVAARDGG